MSKRFKLFSGMKRRVAKKYIPWQSCYNGFYFASYSEFEREAQRFIEVMQPGNWVFAYGCNRLVSKLNVTRYSVNSGSIVIDIDANVDDRYIVFFYYPILYKYDINQINKYYEWFKADSATAIMFPRETEIRKRIENGESLFDENGHFLPHVNDWYINYTY